MDALATTDDRLLGGRVMLRQPAHGYRVAIDPVFLAAAVPARAGARVVELGAGVGAASLCLAVRVPEAAVVGIELMEPLVTLGRQNIQNNGLEGRVDLLVGDIRDVLPAASFDHAMANPPFVEAGRGRRSPNPLKGAANIEGDADLRAWVEAAFRAVRPGGTVTFIHSAERLAELAARFSEGGGGIAVFPLWAKAGADATRVLIQATKGSRAPARLTPGLVLHEPGGAYSGAAEAVLRHGRGLEV